MPNFNSIFLAKLLIISILILQSIHCQADVISLAKADSLFDQKSYKEAMEIYRPNFQSGIYSPAMLLKMAFIAEGIGDKENATLYLSTYYDLNPNSQTLTKIKSLTGQTNLVGYEVSDFRRFLLFLVEYKELILAGLSIFLAGTLLSLWVTVRKKMDSAYWPSILLIMILFLANNFLVAPSAGLVTSSPTLIVDGPTAGGELIEQVEPGHRVKIKSTKDIWFEVEWKNQVGYIKKSDVTRL